MWLQCCQGAYGEPRDRERISSLNEEYSVRIIDYEENEPSRIYEIRGWDVVASRVEKSQRLNDGPPPLHTYPERRRKKHDRMWEDIEKRNGSKTHELSICVGTEHLIALVPPAAEHKPGDVVV
jgi:hypothetical protein